MNLYELEKIGQSFNPYIYRNFFGSILFYLFKHSLYFIKEDKKYKAYCPNCDEYHMYTHKAFKQIRTSKVCPECYREYDKVVDCNKQKEHKFTDYVILDKLTPVDRRVEDAKYIYEFIYEVRMAWKFGQHAEQDKEDPVEGKIKLVGITCTHSINSKYKKAWVRDIAISNSISYGAYIKPQFEPTGKWRNTRSIMYYSRSLDLDGLLRGFFKSERKHITKREYLETNASFLVKSNQIYIAKHNLLNKDQLRCLKVFDCKSTALLYQCRGYIKANSISLSDAVKNNITFNEATLKYLVHNKLALSEYCDYVGMCERLNIKPCKPKDLQRYIVALRRRIHAIEDEKEKKARQALDPFIQLHSKELEKYTYKNDGYEVHPLRTLEECEKQSDLFTNCLYLRYTKPYAEKRCELYVVEKDGAPVIDIEVTNGHLVQARGKMNEQAKGDVKKFISNWANNIRKVTT